MHLYGPPGTGKTHFAVGLGRALAKSGAFVGYLSLPHLNSDMLAPDGSRYKYPSDFALESQNTSANSVPRYIFSSMANVLAPNGNLNKIPRKRPVLILDDYKPHNQQTLVAATEAAAERGGLLIVNSNCTDPFTILEAPAATIPNEEALALRTFLDHQDPEGLKRIDEQRAAVGERISASLRSRMAAAFKFIEFTGEDQRIAHSFWD